MLFQVNLNGNLTAVFIGLLEMNLSAFVDVVISSADLGIEKLVSKQF
jgi:hypothetical protein